MMQRELGHAGAGDGRHHLGAVLGDAAGLVFLADHEAGDVLQEHQGDAALGAELDEMRALQRRLREQDAVVGDDADGIAVEVGEAADQRGAVELLELVELAAVDEPRDHLAHVIGLAGVGGDDAVELPGIVERLARLADVEVRRLHAVEMADDAARDAQRVRCRPRHSDR